MMRFGLLQRLIWQKQSLVSSETTHNLAKEYLSCIHALDRLGRPRPAIWRFITGPYTRYRARSLHTHVDARRDELTRRHKGVLVEILERRGIPSGHERRRIVATIVGAVDTAAIADPSNTSYAALLGAAVHSVVGGGVDARLLVKLHLRGFLDELPSCDERGVLYATALGGGDVDDSDFGEEALELAKRGIAMLTDVLIEMGAELDTFTQDGIASAELAPPHSNARARVRRWLYGEKEMTGERT